MDTPREGINTPSTGNGGNRAPMERPDVYPDVADVYQPVVTLAIH